MVYNLKRKKYMYIFVHFPRPNAHQRRSIGNVRDTQWNPVMNLTGSK